MQDHRTAAATNGVARPPTSHAHHVQRRLLLELVTDPPADGDTIEDLTASLGEPRGDIESAVAALGVCGLAERRAQTVRASKAARRFDELWPTI